MIKTFTIAFNDTGEINYSGSMTPIEAQQCLTQILIEHGRQAGRAESTEPEPDPLP